MFTPPFPLPHPYPSPLPLGHFLVHEIDFLRLVTLAAKQANPVSSSKPTSTETAPTHEDLEGGKLSDKPKMDTSPPSSNTQLAHDDEVLKEKILGILDSDDGTCQSKSAQIMDTILQHRRKRVLELDREKIPPATARFLSEGGSKPQTTDSTGQKSKLKTKNKVKKEKNRQTNKTKQTRSRKESEEEAEQNEEDEQEEDEQEEEEQEELQEEGDEEEVQDEEEVEQEDQEGSEEAVEEEQEDEAESTEESEQESRPTPDPHKQRIIKSRFSNSLSRILAILAKKGMNLSDKTLSLLDSNLEKLSFFIAANPLFKTTSSLVIYGSKKFSRSSSPPYIHMDKLLAALSLPTLSLFRYILGSRVSPKRFASSEKQIISTIVKLSDEINIASIPSPKIRSICA